MKSSTKSGLKNNKVKCTDISCAGCERCMTDCNQDAWSLRSGWESSTQLYGAEAHSYDYYSRHLHAPIPVFKKEAV